MKNVFAPLLHNLTVIWHIGLSFTRVQRLTEWSPRYQLMHQPCGAIYSMGALSIHVPCMQSSLGNPNPNGLRLIVACPSSCTFKPLNLYTPFTVSLLHLSISQTFSFSKTLSCSSTTYTFEPYLIKGMIFTLRLPLFYDLDAHNMSIVLGQFMFSTFFISLFFIFESLFSGFSESHLFSSSKVSFFFFLSFLPL